MLLHNCVLLFLPPMRDHCLVKRARLDLFLFCNHRIYFVIELDLFSLFWSQLHLVDAGSGGLAYARWDALDMNMLCLQVCVATCLLKNIQSLKRNSHQLCLIQSNYIAPKLLASSLQFLPPCNAKHNSQHDHADHLKILKLNSLLPTKFPAHNFFNWLPNFGCVIQLPVKTHWQTVVWFDKPPPKPKWRSLQA